MLILKMQKFTEVKDINMLIYNNLHIEDLKILSCINKQFNNEIKDIILHYKVCSTVIETLNDIIDKNSEYKEEAEHLLLEMYYDMKKHNESFKNIY